MAPLAPMSTTTPTEAGARFRGVIPPVLTPRTEAGQIDVPALHRLFEHLLDGGVHGVFVLGSSGEVPYLTASERELVVREARGVVAGRVPLMVGLNEQTTRRVIEEAERLLPLGGDAAVVTAPFYAQPDNVELAAHFRAVASAVDVPVLAYDIPVRTHHKLPAGVVATLAREGVLAGVKDSSGDDVSFRRVLLETADIPGFSAFTGHEVVVDGALLGGAAGVVPGLGNVDPAGYVRLYEAAVAGRWDDVRREQDRLAQLFRITGVAAGRVSPGATGLGGFKTALVQMDVLSANTMAEPMQALNETEAAAVRELVEAAGLL